MQSLVLYAPPLDNLASKQMKRILAFDKAHFMNPYIELNSKLRWQATSDFHKDFY